MTTQIKTLNNSNFSDNLDAIAEYISTFVIFLS